jgi:putative membrane protein
MADGVLVLGAAVGLVVYRRGAARTARRSGRRDASFALGLVAVVAGAVPPLHGWADRRLTGHMVEHLLLMLVAAPLLVHARAGAAIVAGSPSWLRGASHRVGRYLPSRPLDDARIAGAVVVAHLGVVLAWHLPVAYDAAQGTTAAHGVEHALFLATAVGFWAVVLRRRHGRPNVVALPAVLAAAFTQGALGLILAISETARYAAYPAATDQHPAGAVMVVAGSAVYLAAAAIIVAAWLADAPTPVRPSLGTAVPR